MPFHEHNAIYKNYLKNIFFFVYMKIYVLNYLNTIFGS